MSTVYVPSEKRKITDNIVVDGGEKILELSSKKLKWHDVSNSGSDVNIVEGRLGCTHTSQNYECFMLELSRNG